MWLGKAAALLVLLPQGPLVQQLTRGEALPMMPHERDHLSSKSTRDHVRMDTSATVD